MAQDNAILIENPLIETIEENYYKAVKTSNGIIKGERVSIDGLSKIQKKYNKKNDLLEESTLYESAFNDNQEDKRIVNIYKYNNNGELVRKDKKINEDIKETDIFKYRNGNLIRKCFSIYEDFIEDEFVCSSIEICDFNKNGQKTSCEFYDSKSLDEPIVKRYHYDDHANLFQIEIKTLTGSYISTSFQYDVNGNKTKEVNFNELGIIDQQHYIYDRKENNTTWYRTDANDKMEVEEIYKYSKDNKLVERVSNEYNGLTKITTKYQYFYDHLGNCVKEIEYVEEEPIKITERKINYF